MLLGAFGSFLYLKNRFLILEMRWKSLLCELLNIVCPEKTMGSLPKINNNHAMEITETICVYENTKL